MFKSATGSKQLLLAKIMQIVDASKVKVRFFDRIEENSKISYIISSESKVKTIVRHLVYKVGFQFTKKNTLPARLIKALNQYKM
jgi:hypothetical protein